MGELLQAAKTDFTTGATERLGFVPQEGAPEQLYLVSHEPVAPRRGAVLVCSSILVDLLANYLREVHLARELAVRGHRVLRYHARGTGNSDLDAAEVSLSTLEADARWARDRLEEMASDAPLAIVGTRWGAFAAMAAAADRPDAPIVLVEPILDGHRFFRDAMRARRMSAIARGQGAPAHSDVATALAHDGLVDVLGDVIYPLLFESLADADLLSGARTGQRPALVVQMGGREIRADHRTLVADLRSLGWAADAVIVDVDESWWFRAGPSDALQTGLTMPIANWIGDQFQKDVQ